ncbi:DUF167 domain-containing protein [Candidatus Saccharibacteria bacterium]|nr:DUF167 domain-containing protein [Candidatus Saccharibacteria bacterium]MBQ9017335.1 DUF167 domain-containing protein [Candidatus Saccharibacteria bacterium]
MRIEVTVKPGTSQEKIVKVDEGVYTVYLRAKAHDGEANAALVKLLAKQFGVAKTSIRIVRGQNSRAKIVEL